MKRLLVTFPLFLLSVIGPPPLLAEYAPVREKVPEPLREFRAPWIATVHNIDWPSRRGLSGPQQRTELIELFDLAASVGINAIVLQVRTECDALYPSKIEPWSAWLSGTMGNPPSDNYDPLAFAITEAHRRGMELHAWFNPYRSSATDSTNKSSRHISRTHPSLMMRAGSQVWANPGAQYVQDRAIQVMTDVTSRYDVDAIHMDDYFYPYPKVVNGKTMDQFDDSATYAAYRRKGGQLALRDWRRSQVDAFVNRLYRSIKSTKSHVKVGISPFGIWRPGHPASVKAGLDAYEHICADSRKWLHEGWLDYFSPQLYWRIKPSDQGFTDLTRWWAEQNRLGRHLWPGIASSRIMSSADPGRPASETTAQIDVTRRYGANKLGAGHIHWSFSAIKEDRGGLRKLLGQSYAVTAVPPASPWLGSSPPEGVYVAPDSEDGALHLSFKPDAEARWRLIQVREKPGSDWITLRLVPATQETYRLEGRPYQIAFRHVSRTGILSVPTVLQKR